MAELIKDRMVKVAEKMSFPPVEALLSMNMSLQIDIVINFTRGIYKNCCLLVGKVWSPISFLVTCLEQSFIRGHELSKTTGNAGERVGCDTEASWSWDVKLLQCYMLWESGATFFFYIFGFSFQNSSPMYFGFNICIL